MTYQNDPNDPFASSTRRFDPDNPTSAYPADQYPGTQQYPGTAQYPGEYTTATQYGSGGGGGGMDRRTKTLIAAVVGALLAILLVAFLITVTGGHGRDDASPAVSSSTTSETDTTSSETTSETPSTTKTETTAQTPAGQVVYRLVGDGDLIVVRYTEDGVPMTVATVRSPWSVTTYASDGQASLNAIVVRGSVKCQILSGGKVIAEGQSSGGPLSCAAVVPE
ncbi:hypothetical protein [Gordonia sp. (in: high G+C Gram-positive bacteria)]|uniref:hypothetical protein n=1 Tax=Gordonia sp. (in: high G+C Gram-positive bacteria) TaxID=84139 RepID=UPI0039E44527